MLSQPERNALARELGIGPEACPLLWYGDECDLPCPISDDPAACLWDGAFMRAMGWPMVSMGYNGKSQRDEFRVGVKSEWQVTQTAALYAAWKEMKQCQPNP